MNKRNILLILGVLLLILIIPFLKSFYSHYIKKTEYQITVSEYTEVNGKNQTVSYKNEVLKELETIGLENNVSKSDKDYIDISLSVYEYNRLSKTGMIKYPLFIKKITYNNIDYLKNEPTL